MAGSAPPDCEAEFLAHVAIAMEIRNEFETRVAAATAKVKRKNLGLQHLPERLYVELDLTADYQFDAALYLLTNPHVALAAEQNIRSLLDAIAQFAFVRGLDAKRPMGTELQRATCMTLSRARELEEMYEGAVAEKKIGKVSLNRAVRVRKLYEAMHNTTGCPWQSDPLKWPCRRVPSHQCATKGPCRHQENWPCRPKKRPHMLVGITLDGLERQMWPRKKRLRFLLAQHKVSSLMIHVSLPGKVARDDGHGHDLRAVATYMERYTMLVKAVNLYGMFLRQRLMFYRNSDVAGLAAWERGFYQLPTIKAAESGSLATRCP